MDTSTQIEATVASVATKSMSGGTATSIFGWIMCSETIALTGLMIAFLGFVVNAIFQFRRDRREQALHQSQLAAMNDEHKKK